MNDSASEVLVVLVTAPSDKAGELATGLVSARLAACVNTIPSIGSVYRWAGKIVNDTEALLIIKTTQARFDALRDWLSAHHLYTVPEIIALPVIMGAAAYLNWVNAETQGEPSSARQ